MTEETKAVGKFKALLHIIISMYVFGIDGCRVFGEWNLTNLTINIILCCYCNHHHTFITHTYVQNFKQIDKSLNQLAREATSVCEKKFQNTTPVVDPNSNNNTENEKSIFIATEFLKEALPKFIEQEMVSKNKDRLVKVGRNLVDLVTLADTCEISARNEEFLTLELENIVEECDILTRDDLQV